MSQTAPRIVLVLWLAALPLAPSAWAAGTKDPARIEPEKARPVIACDAYLAACKRHKRPDARAICKDM
jgi:hypothetical protein